MAIGATDQAKDAEKASIVINELVTQFNSTEEHFSHVVEVTSRTREASQNAKDSLETLNITTRDIIDLSRSI